MTDLRTTVQDDRGLIKKIQLAVPGFRGYRLKEDVRIADSMLRLQIADSMNTLVLGVLEAVRERAARAMELDCMNDIAVVIADAKAAESRIRHAEQGYSGISAAYRVGEEELNTMYEYDLSLIDAIRDAGLSASAALDAADAGNYAAVQIDLRAVRSGIAGLNALFAKRIETMAGLGAF